jgi:hypothetical protein
VRKEEQPSVATLARGLITHDELVDVLTVGGTGTSFFRVAITWADGRKAAARELAVLSPIEDSENIDYLHARFDYSDGSELTFNITRFSGVTGEAKGATARNRLAEMSQKWAAFPGRSRTNSNLALHMRTQLGFTVPVFIIFWSIQFALTGDPSPWFWWLMGTIATAAIIGAVYLHLSPSVITRRRLVVLHRNDFAANTLLILTVVTTIAAVAQAVAGIVAIALS